MGIIISHPSAASRFVLKAETPGAFSQWLPALQGAAQSADTLNDDTSTGEEKKHAVDEGDGDGESEDGDEVVESEWASVGAPDLPSAYSYLEETVKLVLQDCECGDGGGYTRSSDKNGVRRYMRTLGDATVAKGEGHIAAPPRAVLTLAWDGKYTPLLDPLFDASRVLDSPTPQVRCVYSKFKPVWPTTARDFVAALHYRVLPDGRIVLVIRHTEHPDAPPTETHVRGQVLFSGYVITPTPGAEDTECDVAYVVAVSPGGSIPAFVSAKVAGDQPLRIAALRDTLASPKRCPPELRTDAVSALGPLRNTGEVPPPTTRPRRRKRKAGGGGGAAAETKGSDGERPLPVDPMSRLPPPSPPQFSVLSLAFLAVVPLVYGGVGRVCGGGVYPTLAAFLALLWALYRCALAYHGNSVMTVRRKMMVATWSPPKEGNIYGMLEIDMSRTLPYIAAKREETGVKITITHLVLKACGMAMKTAPSINGHLILGQYYPSPTADVGCLVAVDGGKNLANAKIRNANSRSLSEIAGDLSAAAAKLRSGRDADFNKTKDTLRALPTWIVRPLIHTVGFLGCALGLNVAPLGVKAYPFGSCMVTSVGMMGLDYAYAPFTSFAHVPLLVVVGAIKKRPRVVGDRVEAVDTLVLTATLDHRFADGTAASRVAMHITRLLENPEELEPLAAQDY